MYYYSDDKSEGEMEAELKGHNNWVRDVAWAPDTGFTTSTIASCCQDGKVFIWQCKDLDKANWDIKVFVAYLLMFDLPNSFHSDPLRFANYPPIWLYLLIYSLNLRPNLLHSPT